MAITMPPPTVPPAAAPSFPVRAAAAYLRRYSQHVVITASPEEITLHFGQLCTEIPNAAAVEMFASLTLHRTFAHQLVDLLQQQLRATPPEAGGLR
jgi:hypothetical protein